jgi:hypothetical protein
MLPAVIQHKIHEIRRRKVMLDYDLAALYEVETKRLKEAVRRNAHRFPDDFMFQLTKEEFESLRSQSASSKGRGGIRLLPYAFTEKGVAMLSAVLNSDKAIDMNINIMRAFVAMRQYMLTYKDLAEKIAALETDTHHRFDDVYEALDNLIKQKQEMEEQQKRKRIGYEWILK